MWVGFFVQFERSAVSHIQADHLHCYAARSFYAVAPTPVTLSRKIIQEPMQ